MQDNRIEILDTTLRDGEQSPGCSMNLNEKIEIARCLEKLKVDVDMALQRPDYLFAVALLDIDRFGAINTSYSINVGDNVLRVVADRIKTQCRVGDTIARIGPDVFAIVLHEKAGLSYLLARA